MIGSCSTNSLQQCTGRALVAYRYRMSLPAIFFNQLGAHDLISGPVTTLYQMVWPNLADKFNRSRLFKAHHQVDEAQRSQ